MAIVINNAKSSADKTRILNCDVCISGTPLQAGGVELYLAYDLQEEQLISLSAVQAQQLIDILSQAIIK